MGLRHMDCKEQKVEGEALSEAGKSAELGWRLMVWIFVQRAEGENGIPRTFDPVKTMSSLETILTRMRCGL